MKSNEDYFQWIEGMGERFVLQGPKQLEQCHQLFAYVIEQHPHVRGSQLFECLWEECMKKEEELAKLVRNVIWMRQSVRLQRME